MVCLCCVTITIIITIIIYNFKKYCSTSFTYSFGNICNVNWKHHNSKFQIITYVTKLKYFYPFISSYGWKEGDIMFQLSHLYFFIIKYKKNEGTISAKLSVKLLTHSVWRIYCLCDKVPATSSELNKM